MIRILKAVLNSDSYAVYQKKEMIENFLEVFFSRTYEVKQKQMEAVEHNQNLAYLVFDATRRLNINKHFLRTVIGAFGRNDLRMKQMENIRAICREMDYEQPTQRSWKTFLLLLLEPETLNLLLESRFAEKAHILNFLLDDDVLRLQRFLRSTVGRKVVVSIARYASPFNIAHILDSFLSRSLAVEVYCEQLLIPLNSRITLDYLLETQFWILTDFQKERGRVLDLISRLLNDFGKSFRLKQIKRLTITSYSIYSALVNAGNLSFAEVLGEQE